MKEQPKRDDREYARFEVHLPVRIEQVGEGEAQGRREELLARPSVWSPTNESPLRDLSLGGASNELGLLAESLLEIVEEVCQLQALLRGGGDGLTAEVLELSGGGGRLRLGPPAAVGDLFLLRFEPDNSVPPLRALIRIAHVGDDPATDYGFAFDAIHPRDRERLIRFIYKMQRRALRAASDGG